jgi:hypothetical protein
VRSLADQITEFKGTNPCPCLTSKQNASNEQQNEEVVDAVKAWMSSRHLVFIPCRPSDESNKLLVASVAGSTSASCFVSILTSHQQFLRRLTFSRSSSFGTAYRRKCVYNRKFFSDSVSQFWIFSLKYRNSLSGIFPTRARLP